MTGSLDPAKEGNTTVGVYPIDLNVSNPGELAFLSLEELRRLHYAVLPSTSSSIVPSAGWFSYELKNPNKSHICSYCNYDSGWGCQTRSKQSQSVAKDERFV